MITHDLKAPLSSILGYADLILDGSLGDVSPDIQESVEAMSRGGHKILAIIENYLTLSRLDSGLMKAVTAPAELVELAGIVISELDPGQNPGRVHLDVEPGFPVVDCDHRLIERALGNLLCNAVKFSREWGLITLSMKRADEKAVRLAGYLDFPGQEHVELSVEDEGMGITGEDLPHVFDRYWRGSRTHGVSGTGLGLSIVKLVAETHGGFVQVESEEGKGSRFSIVIPVRQPLSN
jgi:signal transduction histidine kinase